MQAFFRKYLVAIILNCYCTYVIGQSITINVNDLKQTIDMMGGDMERSSNAIQSAKNKEEIVDWAFRDIAFNVCRVRYDKNQELVEGPKNWDFYAKQINTMQMVKAVNPEIKFFASPRTDYDGYGDENNLPDWICNYSTKKIDAQKYGVFLADYVEYMNSQGLPISYLSTMKEWANYVTASVANEVIETLDSTLEARELAKPLIIDQGFWSLSKGISYLDDIKNRETKNLYHAFCSHNYKKEDSTKWNAFVNAATNLSKAAYNDETGGGYGGPTYGVEPEITSPLGAYTEKCIAYKAGLKGEVFFEIWSRGINKETRAIYFPWGGNGRQMRGYYIMKLFANNILNSQYVSSSPTSMPDVYTMAFRLDNKVALWVINNSANLYNMLPVTINSESIDGLVQKTSWTSSGDIAGDAAELASNTDMFYTNIEAQSLNCYLFDIAVTTSVKETENRNVMVYPTLVKNGIVKIAATGRPTRIQLLDLSGRVVKMFTEHKGEINVSGVKPGMYLVRINSTGKQFTQKIIIE